MPIASAEWLPVDDLLTKSHPLNPIDHSDDIPDLAISLLEGGWVEPIALNTANGRLVGGHGRVMACEWLRNQSEEWFSHRWDLWCGHHEPSQDDAERFTPSYWDQALCLMVNLTDAEHEAMLIRLNDTESQGKDDPQRMRALLSNLPNKLKTLAGYSTPELQEPKTATVAESNPDRQDKQVFEHPDATDYRVRDYPEPDNAEHFSGDVTTHQDDDEIDPSFIEEEPDEPPTPKAPPPVRSLSLSLSWAEWKKWNAWKRENGIAKDTDAFVKGHEAYEIKENEVSDATD